MVTQPGPRAAREVRLARPRERGAGPAGPGSAAAEASGGRAARGPGQGDGSRGTRLSGAAPWERGAMGSGRVRVPEALAGRGGERPLPTFDVPYFKYIDEEDEEDEWSSRSQSSTEDDSGDSLLSDRYVVVSGTPEKILEHLLSDLHLEAAQDKETGKERARRGGGGRGSVCPRSCAGMGERSRCQQSGEATGVAPGHPRPKASCQPDVQPGAMWAGGEAGHLASGQQRQQLAKPLRSRTYLAET